MQPPQSAPPAAYPPQQVTYPQQGAYPQPGAYPQQGQGAYPQGAYPQGTAQVVQGQPGQTIVIQTVAQSTVNRSYESYPAKASLIFGGTQLAIGILLIILNIVGICIEAWLAFIGHGIWCGIFVSETLKL